MNEPKLPDPKLCITGPLEENSDLAECLVPDPSNCRFSLTIGARFVCKHPERRFEVKQ